jgi:putative restriction endonuclease
MPALPAGELVDALLRGLEEAGAQAQLTTPVRSHPREFLVVEADRSYTVWVYIWTITHGGATRSPEEYRIQMTTVEPPLTMNPHGPTLLMGWNPEHGVFGGFDIKKHSDGFRAGSNSVQISLSALRSAQSFGWGFYTNQYNEIAVAFEPAELLNYLHNSEALHTQGAKVAPFLNQVVRLETVPQNELEALSGPRQRIIQTFSKLSRNTNFSKQVVSAYQSRCAVTRTQLRLIDAAHIYPVEAQNSTDSIRNGICLSPTYHRAFDHGLIYLTTDMKMVLNVRKADRLAELNLAGGLPQFCRCLGQEIFLPANPNQRPSPDYIKKANEFRRIFT